MEIATWYKIPFEHKKNVLRKIENSVSRGNWHFVEIRDNKKWWMNELQCKHTKNWTSCHFPMICRRVFYFYLTCCTIVDAMQMENRNTITVKRQFSTFVCQNKNNWFIEWILFERSIQWLSCYTTHLIWMACVSCSWLFLIRWNIEWNIVIFVKLFIYKSIEFVIHWSKHYSAYGVNN